MDKAKEFIKQLISIRDYWVAIQKEKGYSTERTLDGFIFSMLVMFDGYSGENDCHSITLKDDVTRKVINKNVSLHELYCAEHK